MQVKACENRSQLGAAESNRAIDIARDSDAEAVRILESAVEHEREALRPIEAGKRAIRDDQGIAQARFDAEQALRMHADARRQNRRRPSCGARPTASFTARARAR